jgi:hypothetical protein
MTGKPFLLCKLPVVLTNLEALRRPLSAQGMELKSCELLLNSFSKGNEWAPGFLPVLCQEGPLALRMTQFITWNNSEILNRERAEKSLT